jgi:exopolysaccharide biosynthesis polyprenyl glycosylphosphotransferase
MPSDGPTERSDDNDGAWRDGGSDARPTFAVLAPGGEEREDSRDDQHDQTTDRLPRRKGAPQQGGTRVTVPESDLPRGRDDDRLPTGKRDGGPANGPVGIVNGVRGGWPPAPPLPPPNSVTRPAGLRAATGPISLSSIAAAAPAPVASQRTSTVTAGEGPGSLATATATLAPTLPAPGRVQGDHGAHRQGARRANRPVRSASEVVTRPAWVLGGWLLRDGVRPLLLGVDLISCGLAIAVLHRRPHWTVFLFILLLTSLYGLGGLYRSRLSLSLLDDIPRLVGRWLAAVALTVLVQSARARADFGKEDVNWVMVITAMTALILLLVLRALAYNFVRLVRSQRRVAHRTLILGAGSIGEQIARTLLKRSEYGLQPIGFVDNHPLIDPETCAVPLLGGTESLSEVLVREDVRNVVVAFGSVRESQMVDIIRTCDRLRCEIFLVPRLFELHQVSDDMDTVWGLPLVRLRRATYRSHGWHVKRIFDIAFALCSLAVLWPLMLAAAIAVRLEGGPGILFRQERVGADGRRFDVLKFRSLKPANDEESATNWNIKHDDRLGPCGRFLRKTSIDELPQLFNILRGEMSLVGPRPERPHFVAQFRQTYPRYVARHRVPSGLTGWAQVHGLRGDTSIADRAMFDNYYIENWSLWLDVKILIRTVGSVVKGQGG